MVNEQKMCLIDLMITNVSPYVHQSTRFKGKRDFVGLKLRIRDPLFLFTFLSYMSIFSINIFFFAYVSVRLQKA